MHDKYEIFSDDDEQERYFKTWLYERRGLLTSELSGLKLYIYRGEFEAELKENN